MSHSKIWNIQFKCHFWWPKVGSIDNTQTIVHCSMMDKISRKFNQIVKATLDFEKEYVNNIIFTFFDITEVLILPYCFTRNLLFPSSCCFHWILSHVVSEFSIVEIVEIIDGKLQTQCHFGMMVWWMAKHAKWWCNKVRGVYGTMMAKRTEQQR